MNCNYKWYTYIIALLFIISAQAVGAYPYTQYGDLGYNVFSLLPNVTGFCALWLSMRYIHKDSFLKLITFNSKINFPKVLFGAVCWFVLTTIYTIVTAILHPEQTFSWNFSVPHFIKLLVVGITLLPIQTTFEELLFRGYIFQGISRKIGNKWTAMFITAFIFAGMHLFNPEIITFGFWTMLLQYLAISLIFGVIACKENSTEITIGMHYANNFFAMVCVVYQGTVFNHEGALFKVTQPINDYKDTIAMVIAGILMYGAYYWKYIYKHKTDQIS